MPCQWVLWCSHKIIESPGHTGLLGGKSWDGLLDIFRWRPISASALTLLWTYRPGPRHGLCQMRRPHLYLALGRPVEVHLLLIFSRSVMSNSLWAHGLKHTRLPCPSLFPRVCSKAMSIELVKPSNHLIFSHPLLFLLSVFPSSRVFFNESALHIRRPKDWSFSFSPSNEYSGLIYFRIDWFDLFAVQGTLKNLLQHHSSEASILWCSAFFMVQLSHPYMSTGKTIALTIQTFVSKVMFLLFNALSRFVIVFLPRSKCLLISWQQSPSPVILEPKKIKSVTVSIFPHLFAHLLTGKYYIVDPEIEKNLENKFPRHKN